MNRAKRAEMAKQTLIITERGFYNNSQGDRVTIWEDLKHAKENTIHYKEEYFSDILSQRDKLIQKQEKKTIFEVTEETTLVAAKRLIDSKDDDILCLNFASAKNPGGGFLGGSLAQEESLAFASGLYPCLIEKMDMYKKNRAKKCCFYSDDMIYSPRVPVFRNDNGDLLKAYYKTSFISSPAVNAGVIMKREKKRAFHIETVMLGRIEKLLSIALIHNHKQIVLGAWGCGVFRNSAYDVAKYFHRHLKEGIFENIFDKIVFAVYSKSQKGNIEPFREKFLG